MKTKITALIGIALSTFIACEATAITLADATYRHLDIGSWTLDAQSPASGTFDLIRGGNGVVGDNDGYNRDGFDPSSELVTEAIVGFIFQEFNGGTMTAAGKAQFDIGSYLVGSVAGSPIPDVGFGAYEISFDTFTYSALKASLLVDIQADGMVDWMVSLTDTQLQGGTSVVLKSAYLGANAEPRPVPDAGSTAAMFGLALLGTVCIYRRKR